MRLFCYFEVTVLVMSLCRKGVRNTTGNRTTKTNGPIQIRENGFSIHKNGCDKTSRSRKSTRPFTPTFPFFLPFSLFLSLTRARKHTYKHKIHI